MLIPGQPRASWANRVDASPMVVPGLVSSATAIENARTASFADGANIGVPAAGLMGWFSASNIWKRLDSSTMSVDGNNPTSDSFAGPAVRAVQAASNGAGLIDRWRNNLNATPISFAARSSTTNSADQENFNGRGVELVLVITAVPGVDTVQLLLQGKDDVNYYTILQGAAIAATGVYVYQLYPGIGAASLGVTGVESRVLRRNWRVRMVHSAATSFSYYVGSSVIL